MSGKVRVPKYPRRAPRVCRRRPELVHGGDFSDLRYRSCVQIRVDGREVSAVVDLYVPKRWGGPQKAFARFVKGKVTPAELHVQRKLVWHNPAALTPNDGWWEFYLLAVPEWGEITSWFASFDGQPPLPMPIGFDQPPPAWAVRPL